MSEFKVGDRITGTWEYDRGRKFTGVVVATYPDRMTLRDEYLIAPEGEIGNRYVLKDTAVAADPAVHKGDRVKVEFEGEVTWVGAGALEVDDGKRRHHVTPSTATLVERPVEPLKPLKPGTIVRGADGGTWLVHENRVTYTSPRGVQAASSYSAAELARHIADAPGAYTVYEGTNK